MKRPEPRDFETLEDYYDMLEEYEMYLEYKYDEYRDDILLENYEKEQEHVRGNS